MSDTVIALQIAGYALRPWRASDAQAMHQHINHPTIARNMADWYPREGYPLDAAQSWTQGRHGAVAGDTNWAIAWQGGGGDEAVGSCGVHPQGGFARCNTEIGYWLGAAHWGLGVGSAVVAALTRQAFSDPGVTRVFALIHADNAASQRVCEKNGFVCEGLRRKSVMKWGEAIDTVVWAVGRM